MKITFTINDVPEEEQKPSDVSNPCPGCGKAGEKVIGVRQFLAHIVDAPCITEPEDCEVYLAGDCDGKQTSKKCRGLWVPYQACADCDTRWGDTINFCSALGNLVKDELFNILDDIPEGHEVVVTIKTRSR